MYTVHVSMRDEKEERNKQGQTNNKANQYSTPKAVTFPKKNKLPQVGLEPTTTTIIGIYQREREGRVQQHNIHVHVANTVSFWGAYQCSVAQAGLASQGSET